MSIHVRYPEDLLLIQAKMYRIYHMQNPEVLYNREDVWEFAEEKYRAATQTVIPYYTVMKLPGEERQEFLLMISFKPQGTVEHPRNNMVAWMAGRSDGEHYGQLLVYKFPKTKLTPGHLQVESFVDSDPEMSSQITLWDQKGSEVIRGNLLAIPIANTILYVEPIYLQAEEKTAAIPRLERVVVSIGETVAWGKNLQDALHTLFKKMDGSYVPQQAKMDSVSGGVVVNMDVAALILQAVTHFENYVSLTGEGKIIEAAQELVKHREALRNLQAIMEKQQ